MDAALAKEPELGNPALVAEDVTCTILDQTAADPSANFSGTKWRSVPLKPSLEESHASIKMPPLTAAPWRMLLAFGGCGAMISVGYMDPGNWATALAGGSQFGYSLLFVVLLSNILAMLLQHLSLKLGVASGRDLAQACRDAYPNWTRYPLWAAAQIAICACDMAEVIGTSVALKLLFHIPLWAGLLITLADVVLVTLLESRGFRLLELMTAVLVLFVFACFVYELALASPNWKDVGKGFIPTGEIFTNGSMLYIAIGILGATVMPHNLYLHSAIIQTRDYPRTAPGRRLAIRYGTIDSCFSLMFAFLINAALLILAGATFYYGVNPRREGVDINDAWELLAPSLGTKAASIMFALALLASGQNSVITGTLAGQVVMEGFLDLKMKAWLRRLLTRATALLPAVIVAAVMGDAAVGQLLVISQVILSMQLSFAVFPLVQFTSSKAYVGKHANHIVVSALSGLVALFIAGLNVYLLITVIGNKGVP